MTTVYFVLLLGSSLLGVYDTPVKCERARETEILRAAYDSGAALRSSQATKAQHQMAAALRCEKREID